MPLFFYTFIPIISRQVRCRPFASSGLPRPSFACALRLDPRAPHTRCAVPVQKVAQPP